MSDRYIAVLSCSLNSASKSRLLARAAVPVLEQGGFRVEFVDLRELALPFCDGEACYENENVQKLTSIVAGARAVVFASPIYNFDVSAATKNVIELVGSALERKPVAVLCGASGLRSAMAPYSFVNSLMLDFKCLVVPPSIIADETSFDSTSKPVPAVAERISAMAFSLQELVAISTRES